MASACCAVSRPKSGKKTGKQKSKKRSSKNRKTSISDSIEIGGGTFLMGTDDEVGFPEDGEGPIREVTLAPYRIDETAVTNAQFSRFVKDTGYKTEAEAFGWSFVFHSSISAGARLSG